MITVHWSASPASCRLSWAIWHRMDVGAL